MSVSALRATLYAAGAASLAMGTVPAQAQADRTAVLGILVECAKIDDPTARLACYDNNMTRVGAVARSTVPGRQRVQGGAGPISAQSPAGFGAEMLRTPDSPRASAGRMDSIRPKVSAVAEREPGIYLVTVEDGAQWVFAQGVSLSYRVPRVGSIVEIERGSMGSFLMRVDGQEGVQVRRVR